MLLALLLRAAEAGSLQLPPGEDLEAWRAVAVLQGVELVAERGDLELVHEGARWELRHARDAAVRFPLPPPLSPEQRAAVLALAARLLSEPAPLASELLLDDRFREQPFDGTFVITEQAEAPPAPGEIPPMEPEPERPDVPPVVAPTPPAPLPRPVGWVVGVQLTGGAFVSGEGRLAFALAGGARLDRGLSLGLVVEAGTLVPTAWPEVTIQRDSARAECGLSGVVIGAGLGRAEIVADDRLRGQLLFPVFAAEYEVPFRVGPLWLLPRAGVHFAAVDVTLATATHSAKLAPVALSLGVRVERVLGAIR